MASETQRRQAVDLTRFREEIVAEMEADLEARRRRLASFTHPNDPITAYAGLKKGSRDRGR
jgi:hypothetical protein